MAHGAQVEGVSTDACCTCVDLWYFTVSISADAKWTARWNRTLGSGSPTPSCSPDSSQYQTAGSYEDSPACKAPRAVSPVMTDRSAHAATSTITSADKYSAPTVPVPRSVPYGGWRPSLPISLLLPRFTDRAFVPSLVRSSSVAT